MESGDAAGQGGRGPRARRAAAPDLADLAPQLREAVYTTLGFGVLGFQRAQVARRDLSRGARECIGWALPVARAVVRSAGRVMADQRASGPAT